MNNSNLLVLRNLTVWYTRNKPVLENFSMELGTNEIVGLIGLNGAGKTTLIKTLSGLLDSFRIENALWQEKAFMFRDREFKQNRYIVFAEDHSFQFFTFREYISYVESCYGKQMTDVDELIRGFQFEAYTDVLLRELSTGNLKKAYLITAFALKPGLMILDEPVNGLDFQSTEYLYRRIEDYRQHGTILFPRISLKVSVLLPTGCWCWNRGRSKRALQGRRLKPTKSGRHWKNEYFKVFFKTTFWREI